MSMAERESLGATLKAYEKLREADESRWPELMLAAVTCKGPEPIGPNDAAERLRATANGWVRHRSGARRLGEPANPKYGPPLFAEWIADGESFRLSPHPEEVGNLALWRYAEETPQNGESLGDRGFLALRQEVAVLDREWKGPAAEGASPPVEQPLLVYHAYWGGTESDPSALRRLFARFVGFAVRPEFAGRAIVIR